MDIQKSNKNIKPSTTNIALFVGSGLIVILLLFGVIRTMGVGRSTATGGGTKTTGGGRIMGSPSPVGGWDDNEESWLVAHNTIRDEAWGEPVDLEWDEDLAADALTHAEYMAGTGNWGHSETTNQVCDADKTTSTNQPNKCGENLSKDWGNTVTPMETVQRWYDECEYYPGSFTSNSGHYTQVVWKNAKKVGCAYATNNAGEQYGVCLYDTGNINVNVNGSIIGFNNYVPTSGSCDAKS